MYYCFAQVGSPKCVCVRPHHHPLLRLFLYCKILVLLCSGWCTYKSTRATTPPRPPLYLFKHVAARRARPHGTFVRRIIKHTTPGHTDTTLRHYDTINNTINTAITHHFHRGHTRQAYRRGPASAYLPFEVNTHLVHVMENCIRTIPKGAPTDTIAWLVDFTGMNFSDVAVVTRLAQPGIELFDKRQVRLVSDASYTKLST